VRQYGRLSQRLLGLLFLLYLSALSLCNMMLQIQKVPNTNLVVRHTSPFELKMPKKKIIPPLWSSRRSPDTPVVWLGDTPAYPTPRLHRRLDASRHLLPRYQKHKVVAYDDSKLEELKIQLCFYSRFLLPDNSASQSFL